MKKVVKSFINVGMFCLLMCFIADACALTKKEEQELVNKISDALQYKRPDKSKGITFDNSIKYLKEQELFRAIILADCEAISIYTVIILIKKFPSIAPQLFRIVIKLNLGNTATYNNFITVAGNAGDFATAQNAFNEACERGKANAIIYNSFITAAGNAGNFAAAQNAFNEVCERGKADVITYSSFITAAGNAGNFAAAQKAFNEVCGRGKADVITYNNFITVAGNAGNFAAAQKAFNEACERGKAYSSFITAASNAGNFAAAQNAFNEACERGKADVITYSSFITAADNAGNFAAAQKAFNEACEQGKADVITYNSYIDTLIKANEINSAIELFNKHLNIVGSKKNDFHGFSFGGAYIACHMLINELKNGEAIDLIIGRGSHSKEEHIVRRAVELFAMQNNNSVKLEANRHNVGRVRFCKIGDYQNQSIFKTKFLFNQHPKQGDSSWNIAGASSSSSAISDDKNSMCLTNSDLYKEPKHSSHDARGILVSDTRHPVRNPEQQVDEFIDGAVIRYIADIRNADPKKGEVLWGGDIDLGYLANILNLNITVYQYQGNRIINNRLDNNNHDANTRDIYLWYDGVHYAAVYNPDYPEDPRYRGEVIGDGNCMFHAVRRAMNRTYQDNIRDAEDLRNLVSDAIAEDVYSNYKNSPIYIRYWTVFMARDENELQTALLDLPRGVITTNAEALWRRLRQDPGPASLTSEPKETVSLKSQRDKELLEKGTDYLGKRRRIEADTDGVGSFSESATNSTQPAAQAVIAPINTSIYIPTVLPVSCSMGEVVSNNK